MDVGSRVELPAAAAAAASDSAAAAAAAATASAAAAAAARGAHVIWRATSALAMSKSAG